MVRPDKITAGILVWPDQIHPDSMSSDSTLIIGPSLSKPHIDCDKRPTSRGNLCMWHTCSVCRPNVPENTPTDQSITCSAHAQQTATPIAAQ